MCDFTCFHLYSSFLLYCTHVRLSYVLSSYLLTYNTADGHRKGIWVHVFSFRFVSVFQLFFSLTFKAIFHFSFCLYNFFILLQFQLPRTRAPKSLSDLTFDDVTKHRRARFTNATPPVGSSVFYLHNRHVILPLRDAFVVKFFIFFYFWIFHFRLRSFSCFSFISVFIFFHFSFSCYYR